jgi:hypothetical protein
MEKFLETSRIFPGSPLSAHRIVPLRRGNMSGVGRRPDSARTSAWERHSVYRRITPACNRTHHLNGVTNRTP